MNNSNEENSPPISPPLAPNSPDYAKSSPNSPPLAPNSPDYAKSAQTSPGYAKSAQTSPTLAPTLAPPIKSIKEKTTINEALNEYYKLKAKYQEIYHEKYIKPILRSNNKSKREKRLEYQKLPKAECINCKRNVGSIFSIKTDPEEYSRTFIASCGDLNDPCPLDINFDYTFRNELNKELLDADKDINEIKNKIIIDKNNMMFGYVEQSKAIENFNTATSDLKSITEGAGFIMDINIQLNDNPVKKDLIKTNEDKLGIEFLLPFKDMIKTFDEGGNVEVLNKAMKFYVEEMVPLITTIRNLKYEVCYVDFVEKKDLEDSEEKGDLNFLIQKKNSLYNLEYTLYGNDELNSFVRGVKTRKSSDEPIQIHKKTRKLRPTIKLVEEVKEGEEGEEPRSKEKQDIQTVADMYPDIYKGVEGDIVPQFGPNMSVTWVNENGQVDMTYQQTWNGLSPEYKAALSDDEPWMKKTLDYFIEYSKLKKENKVPYTSSREFVHPDNILLPPVKFNDTEYDYGNSVYNRLLNNSGQPPIWLTMLPRSVRYADRNPDSMSSSATSSTKFIKSAWSSHFPELPDAEYKPYLNAIASVLGSKLKFTRF